MSSLTSGSLPSNKTLQEPELSDFFIKKPRTLPETCPVETSTQRLPLIEGKPRKKRGIKKSRESSSSSEDNWLKPGISLPKLQTKAAPPPSCSEREEVIEHIKNADDNSVTWFQGPAPITDISQKHKVSKALKCYKHVQEGVAEVDAASPDATGPSACDLLFRVPSSELNFDDFKVEEEPLEESHALQRWEYWLKEHKKLQNYLSKRLNRKKCDLQFQKSQNYRMILEDKSLFLRAQIPVADKWRGHPFLWKSDIKLGGSEKLVNEEPAPEYHGVKTRLERGEVPDMEFIGIPMTIKKEKSIICEDSTAFTQLNSHWEKLEYRQDRLRDLREQAKMLKPHDIEMDELEIVGKKIPQKKQDKVSEPFWPTDLPKIQVSPAQGEDSCPKDFYWERSSVFCLSIGGEELEYEIGNEYCQKTKKSKFALKWEIDFGVNAVGVLSERTLRVENKGTMAVRYNLLSRKVEKTQSLDSLQPIQHEPRFFFNKNSGIFLPGQIYDLKFYHYTKRPGIRKEIWHLKTNPPLSKKGENGTIILWGVSTDYSLDSGISALDSYLRNQVMRSVIGFIVQVLLSKALSPLENVRGIEYRSLFFEKELFEYQNPKHYYHSGIVKELRKFFEQIPQKNQLEWDSSLASLIELITTYMTGKERDSILRQIAEKAKKLFRPNRLLVRNIKKYRMTYEILCKMANFMEEDYDYLKTCLVQKKEEVKRVMSEYEEVEEQYSGFSLKSEEKGAAEEFGSNIPEIVFEIKPINFLYFQTMFYIKVYHRVSEAVENMVGALETSKLLEPWKEIDYKLTKPSRGGWE